jgi:hypothetical protein
MYSITPDGESAFQEMLRESLANFEPTASHSTIGIAFMDALPPEDVVPLLQKRRKIIEEALSALTIDEAHHGGFGYVILNQVRHLSTEMEWLDEVIENIHISQT